MNTVRRHFWFATAFFIGAGLLSACDPYYLSDGAGGQKTNAPAQTPPVEQSAESKELAEYYKRVQDGFLVQGQLRTDGGGPDTPFNARNLVDNFERIALYNEYANDGQRIVARQTESLVHRWDTPIRMKVEFGASVPLEQRQVDRTRVTNYAQRLGKLTGVPIRMTNGDANFNVFVVNEDERRALGPRLRQILPRDSEATISAVVDMPRSDYCLVFAWTSPERASYTNAVAIIRGEHPDLMRLSCIHEELAQGMGLPNDSPSARPSIFNDDEEFAFLTGHDELLLKILYDPRIKSGMTAQEARAQAEIIAAELMGDDS